MPKTRSAVILRAARAIAKTIARHVANGDAQTSPLPFRVNLKNGKVLDSYTAHMLSAVLLFDEMIRLGENGDGVYQSKRDLLWKWVLKYPVTNNEWSGYYEDVPKANRNKNQQSPMETARFMLRHPEMDPDYKQHVPALLAWVKNRFGNTKRYGATSIREQDVCAKEMSSHTARYASVAAKWYGVTQNPQDREEARASFALATYSAYSKYSRKGVAVNYVGIGYVNPWFIDSYFDYLSHILEGMAELPEMAPADSDHILGSDGVVKSVTYQTGRIEYATFESHGNEILRICFRPHSITADGTALPTTQWVYGDFRGVPGVLRIHREFARHIVIKNTGSSD